MKWREKKNEQGNGDTKAQEGWGPIIILQRSAMFSSKKPEGIRMNHKKFKEGISRQR